MQKDTKKLKILSILWPILSTIIILLGATLIYLYSNGYRFNFSNQEFKRTGVISVESEPFLADMYINDKKIGITPKSNSLEVGTYNTSVEKSGYVTWNKQLNVVEGKITPVFPFLILSEIQGESVWESKLEYVKNWSSIDKNVYIILTRDNAKYALWSYRVNTSILDFSTNPIQILTPTTEDITIIPSYNGDKAILVVSSKAYLIDTKKSNTLSSSNILNITNPNKYTITWAEDNKKLILENDSEIYAYNIDKNTAIKVLTKTKGTKYVWNTDKEGYLYLVTEIKEEDLENVYIYKISQLTINGTVTSKDLIEKIYLLKSDEYIKQYRESGIPTSQFNNSPVCTQTAGEITTIDINQDSEGIFIKTTLASYWYFANEKKYQMVATYPSELIAYSPDSNKFIHKNEMGFFIFTLDKEKEDHTVDIGSKKINNIDSSITNDIRWLSDSIHLYYKENNTIYFADIDGDNKTKLAEEENTVGYTLENSRNYLKTITYNDTGIQITKYKIH
ncbi:MAG: PEGA domain-containing protein [Candidatus Dojkabacteria bacterium]|nr:PEGA domain-containing protein [Candidatus Dojkabacteria bacterium]